MVYDVIVAGKVHRLELEKVEARWKCRLDGKDVEVDAVLPRPDVLSLLVDGRSFEVMREQTATDLYLCIGNARLAVELRDPRSLRSRKGAALDEKGPRQILASMPGRVVRLLVEVGADVEAGQGIVVVEAMKMQNEIKSPKKGIVRRIVAAAGDAVNAGDLLATVE